MVIGAGTPQFLFESCLVPSVPGVVSIPPLSASLETR